jgi:hypothetical protein
MKYFERKDNISQDAIPEIKLNKTVKVVVDFLNWTIKHVNQVVNQGQHEYYQIVTSNAFHEILFVSVAVYFVPFLIDYFNGFYLDWREVIRLTIFYF